MSIKFTKVAYNCRDDWPTFAEIGGLISPKNTVNYKSELIDKIAIRLMILCLIPISLLSPIEHPFNPITQTKKDNLNMFATLYSCLLCIISLVLIIYKNKYFASIYVPFLFSTASMIFGKIMYKNASYDK